MPASALFQTALPALLFGGAASVMAYALLWNRRAYAPAPASAGREERDAQAEDLIFNGRVLQSGPPRWERLVRAHRGHSDDWAQFLDIVVPHLPEIAIALSGPEAIAGRELRVGNNSLSATTKGGFVAIRLDGPLKRIDPERDWAQAEAGTLRAAFETTGIAVWRESDAGRISWVNGAYLDLARERFPNHDPALWPPPALFDAELLQKARLTGRPCRAALRQGSSRPGWYTLTGHGFRSETIFAALPADAEVAAETRLRDYTRGLSKTVERLPVGLALFDRTRRLILHNPVLAAMTALPLEFLGSNPSLFGFLDRLREARIMPEPKDYPGWRLKMAELEAAAAQASYLETWSLPDGRTYRVTGYPHTDGALVFLFEDISSEVSLTRRFRSELEMSQAVIDSLDDAVAVFSNTGVLAMVNRAYDRLWGSEPSRATIDISITDAVRTWMSKTAPSPAWGDLRDFVGQASDRVEWSANVRMRDGRGLYCRIIPIDGGATMTRFRTIAGEEPGIAQGRRELA